MTIGACEDVTVTPGLRARPPVLQVSSAERLALVALTVPAAAVLGAWIFDALGFRFLPVPMLVFAVVCAGLVWRALRGQTRVDTGDTIAFTVVVCGLTVWLLWLARPALLPLSTGPDLTHHLLLIDFIEQHWRLVHDQALARQLGEMAEYTPGAHILGALAGAWSGTDGLRAFHALQSIMVGLETGVLYLIARRTLPADTPRALAMTVVGLLFVSPRYLLGAFTEYGFFAQVVAETFVIAAWWTTTAWDQRPDWRLALATGLLGATVFLVWPVYSGPPMLAAFLVIAFSGEISVGDRLRHGLVTFVPVVVVAGAYLLGRLGWLRLAGTGGSAPVPSMASLGVPLAVLALFGAVLLLTRRSGRVTMVFVGALAAQTLALYIVATRSGAPQPYMALKMFYLWIRPMAVCAAVAVAWSWSWLASSLQARRGEATAANRTSLLVGAVPVAILLAAAWPLWRHPQRAHPKPAAISAPLYDAGRWARANLPAGCIEYLVGDDETAYWLHLAVLRNPRVSDRTGNNSTYEPTDAVVRWLLPGGLPYAIADLDAIPRDVREELDIIYRSGSAAVAKRRTSTSCATP